MAIDLSEVVNDPDLGSCFTVLRNTGKFGPGGWQPGPDVVVNMFGIVSVASDEALKQVPEADRVEGSMQFVSSQPIYETLSKNSATSDKISWAGELYRVQSVAPWKMAGYWSAIAIRMSGQ